MTQALVSQFDVGLFDLDGVCYLGQEPVVHAPESISAAVGMGLKQAYVTNNASRHPAVVAAQLEALGIPAPADSVVNSAQVGSQMLAEHVEPGSKILVLGAQALRDEVTARGLVVVESADDHPAAVIQGFYPEANWADLSEAALAIRAGALYVCTNLDKTIPRERGLMVGNGSLARAISNSTGVEPLSAGKPEPEIFQIAAKMLEARSPFAIGDNLDTDIQGAVSAGMPVLHVLTGLASARDICLAPAHQRPTYLADDLRAMLEPYPDSGGDGPQAWVGEAHARWTGSAFEVGTIGDDDGLVRRLGADPVELNLNQYRSLALSAWGAADSGVSVSEISAALPEITVSRDHE
ncbi:MAG: HAD-IIA family hydrolase [Ancrocorticia sp.]|uniref:HAD-IIA family hydrolase n=1 Tax=Ancrocorticia sp. TaxID=2593684 RepID=UPI003F90028A